ncbi:MAG: hypothetical protein II794_06800 [Oscillospiraceae bacterium]|nr:hypothetical protein [Oscillospiraceae bacterium]
MRRKTFAFNSIIIGVLLGLLVWATTENVVLGVVTAVGVSVVGFFLIRFLENLLYKGVDAAADKIGQAIQKKKEEKEQDK